MTKELEENSIFAVYSLLEGEITDCDLAQLVSEGSIDESFTLELLESSMLKQVGLKSLDNRSGSRQTIPNITDYSLVKDKGSKMASEFLSDFVEKATNSYMKPEKGVEEKTPNQDPYTRSLTNKMLDGKI